MASQSINPLPEYIDRAALAQRLGKTIRSIDRLLLNGGGPPHIKLGNRRLFRVEAVSQWLLSLETPAPPQSKRNGRGAR